MKKIFAILVSLCLMMALCQGAMAAPAADYESVLPLMDLVSAASMYSANSCESVPGEEGVLSASFTNAFILVGQVQSPEVGVSSSMLEDTDEQAALLSSIFAAELPTLESIPVTEEDLSFIGFYPLTAATLDNGDIQLVGEIYFADKPLRQLSPADYVNVAWRERGLFILRADQDAMFGYRVMEFAVGSDLDYEEEFTQYSDEVSVEYVSSLGFTVLYPAVFTDDLLSEDAYGVSAALPDGSATFSAKYSANTNGYTLNSYLDLLSGTISGSTVKMNDETQNGTIFYLTGDGYAVFDVIYVTEDGIYQAELTYKTELMSEYNAFDSYLENSFVIDVLSLG